MYTVSELQEAIDDLNNKGAHTIQNVSKLASIYTVLDHITIDSGYSTEYKATNTVANTSNSNVIGNYGDTEFLRAIKGKNPEAVWALIDELMYTLYIVDDALYNSVIDRLHDIT